MKDPNDARRTYWHAAAIDGAPLWRHGRARFAVHGWGRPWRYGTPETNPLYGRRDDLGVTAEWCVARKKYSFGVGARLKWGTNGSGTTPDLSFHLGRLGSLYLGFENLIPYTWLERVHPDGRTDYDTREFELNVGAERFTWSFWKREHVTSRDDPWWMHTRIDYRTFLFGRAQFIERIVEAGDTVVPLPEGTYPATYEVLHCTRRHTRPLGRFRDALLGAEEWDSVRVEPGVAPKVPGKGENSWDCDDDAIYGMTVRGCHPERAVAALVESVLRERRRHGGQHMNTPGAQP